MSKNVEFYRVALEQEISRWSGFNRALRKEDREAFEEMMTMCRSFASESIDSTNQITFEPMVIFILIAQQKKLQELNHKLNEALWQKICSQAQPGPKSKP